MNAMAKNIKLSLSVLTNGWPKTYAIKFQTTLCSMAGKIVIARIRNTVRSEDTIIAMMTNPKPALMAGVYQAAEP